MRARSGTARIAYDIDGPPEGVGVLLIHAGVTDGRGWRPLVERLSGKYRCVVYDRRGFGETTYEREEGWSSLNDAVAVLDAAGLSRAVVVGASAGGAIAMDLALARPDRVVALGLIGSAVRGAPPFQTPPAPLLDAATRAQEEGDLAELNRIHARIWLDGIGAPEGRVGGATRQLFLDMNGRALRADDPGEPAAPPDAWPRLHEIDAPTLVLVGDLDLPGLCALSGYVAGSLGQATLHLLRGVAHLPHLEGHAETLDLIEEFVDSRKLPLS